MTRKGIRFDWTEACESSFQELKTRLTTTPVLVIPERGLGYVVFCDASRDSLGCVLMQGDKYHLGKANVVADALSQKYHGVLDGLTIQKWKMLEDIAEMGLQCYDDSIGCESAFLFSLVVQPTLITRIIEPQRQDSDLATIHQLILGGDTVKDWTLHTNGGLRFKGLLVVPMIYREDVLREFHTSRFTVHLGKGRTSETSKFIAAIKCSTVEIGVYCYGFCDRLLRSQRGNESVWFIIDRLTKTAHFLLVKVTYSAEVLGRLYVREIVRLHGVSVAIVLDRDAKFTSKLWQGLHTTFGSPLHFSLAFHPQMNG
ncbi:uncharacterized protein LOC132281309 [Cornus florida]|uniref:uncharacterized protein LOC132281309 n=1 Tax=Cornus florida TaxID=4283 RepID=UPI00289B5694|nr:uncharacterized protein LOC132281309 [Cornus florida]